MPILLKVTKFDAVRRQLDAAIRLYFGEDDPVAIHTLTAAAHQLLSDLNQASSGAPTLKDTILSHVRPDKRDDARRLLSAASNFFKHADRDPHTVLEFLPSQTEILLLDGCLKYRDVTRELVPTLATYQTWFWLGPGAEFVDVTTERNIDRFREAFRGASRRSFFNEVLPIVASIPTGGHDA